ncbi:MAG: hypothetical protein PHQ33_06695 [Bacteroidales bacterium]|nr:hypothetical protein [Bacteroidales bacterium]
MENKKCNVLCRFYHNLKNENKEIVNILKKVFLTLLNGYAHKSDTIEEIDFIFTSFEQNVLLVIRLVIIAVGLINKRCRLNNRCVGSIIDVVGLIKPDVGLVIDAIDSIIDVIGLIIPDVGSIIDAVDLIIAAKGLQITIFQWRKSIRIRRIEFLSDILQRVRLNTESSKIMTMIEYDKKWYDEKFHDGGELEQQVDRFLTNWSYACYLIEKKMIEQNEIGLFQYDLKRICTSEDVQKYLWNLYHFSRKINSKCPYESLIKYAETNLFINKDEFENIHSVKYSPYKNLNF